MNPGIDGNFIAGDSENRGGKLISLLLSVRRPSVTIAILAFCLMVSFLLTPGQSQLAYADGSYAQADAQRIYQILRDNNNKDVRALPQGEREILMAMLSLKSGRLNEAMDTLRDPVLGQDPLASLIKAEIYRQQAIRAVSHAGDYAASMQGNVKRLETANLANGLTEAERRLQAFTDKLEGHYGIPFDLLAAGSDVVNVFLVDKARSRMFIFKNDGNGRLKRVADEYVAIGARLGDKKQVGDGRTPSGVYRFVDKLIGNRLPVGYGPVAFPIDYPNALDRLLHHNGYGIWMHGYADGIGRRPPQDTRGCFVLPNPRLEAIGGQVRLGHSWVIIGDNIVFDQKERKRALLNSVQSAVKAWKGDWESLDARAYLSHYHQRFRSGKRDLKSWSRSKRRANLHKRYIHLELSDFTIIHNPARVREGEVVLVEFDQRYRSNNFSGFTRKRLYLVRKNYRDAWRILVEKNVKPLPKQNIPDLLYEARTNERRSVRALPGQNTAPSSLSWMINLASYKSRAGAMAEAANLMNEIHPSASNHNLSISMATVRGRRWFRIRLGYFGSKVEAARELKEIRRKYSLSGAWIDYVRKDGAISL